MLYPVLLGWSGLVSGKFILSTIRFPLLYSLLFSFIIPSFLPMVSWRINTGIGVCDAHTGRFRKALFVGNNPLLAWTWAHPWWPGWNWTCGFVVACWCVFGCGWFVVTMFCRNGSLGSFSESIPPESGHIKLTSQFDSAMPASKGGSGEPRFVEWFCLMRNNCKVHKVHLKAVRLKKKCWINPTFFLQIWIPPRVYIAHVVSFDTSGWPNTSVGRHCQ